MQYEFPYERKMVAFYERWLEKQGLTPMSADELLYELMADVNTDINVMQQKWLQRFIRVWEYFAGGRGKF